MPRAKKKAVKKTAKRKAVKRRVCETRGCRKTALPESPFCRVCIQDQDALESVVKVSEVEALRFAKLDGEMRNDRQAIQIIEFQIAEVKHRAEEKIVQFSEQRKQLSASITARKPEYLELIRSLAEKYGIEDPARMTIDPETCVIRDLSKT